MNLDEVGVKYLHAIMMCYGNPRASLWDLIDRGQLDYMDLHNPKYTKLALLLLNMSNNNRPREVAYAKVMAAMRAIISPPKAVPNRGPQPRKKWNLIHKVLYP